MILGIDLGTTHSLAALWEGDRPRLIPNALGDVLTPSCVSLDTDGTVLVGRAARERLQSHPERTAATFKRLMGTNKVTRLGSRDFRPEELSSFVLRALKEDAEAALGHPVTEAIITVPAYFSDAQRKATKAAAQLAGLQADRLLNEPSAAALAYGIHQRDQETKFLVFDLGGGTFDVSILDLFEGVMEVRASSGDTRLGGEDFVQVMVDHFFATGALPGSYRSKPLLLNRVAAQVEILKRALSDQPQARVVVQVEGKEHPLEMDEATLERLAEPLLQRLRTPVERVLRDARMRVDDLDSIVLAGGASRMPLVHRLVARMFGRPIQCTLNPDEVVAMGAAVQAGLKMRNAALQDMVMTDVAPYSLGVEVSLDLGESRADGHFDPVIERNHAVPVSRVSRYFPVQDGQKELLLRIYQGEARLVKDNLKLGELKIRLSPPGKRDDHAHDVRFTYDLNGLLEVEATPAKGGPAHRLVIQGNPGILSEEQIEARLKALAHLKIHPREQMENRTVLAEGERIYTLLHGEERTRFGQEMAQFEAALATQEERTILPARQRLQEVIAFIDNEVILKSGPIQ